MLSKTYYFILRGSDLLNNGKTPEKSGIVGIAELTLTILPTESEKNIDYAAALIKVHHVRGFEVSLEDIDAKLHENKHIRHIQEDIGGESKLEMNCPPRELLQRLPKELYYLSIINYFIIYEKRGCNMKEENLAVSKIFSKRFV